MCPRDVTEPQQRGCYNFKRPVPNLQEGAFTTELLRHGTGVSLSLNRFVTKYDFTQMSGVLLYCLPRFYFECLSWCICPFIMYETCMTWRLWSILWGRWINICNCICRTYCLVTEPFSGAELSAAGMDVTLEVNWCSRGNPTCSDI